MRFRPKLVALDIDGTLVDAHNHLPEEVHRAVRRVVDAGVPVVLTTGRAWHGTCETIERLGLPPGFAVIANGAMVVEYPSGRIVHQVCFDPKPIISSLTEAFPKGRIAVVDEVAWRVSHPFPEGELSGDVFVESLSQLCSRPVSRLVLRDPETPEDVFQDVVAGLTLDGVGSYIGWSSWVDFTPKGVNKSSGLALVCEQLGVAPSEVLAIGDGTNDVELLEWAGRGVAMGDAIEPVKAAANFTTGRFSDGGTVTELGRWF